MKKLFIFIVLTLLAIGSRIPALAEDYNTGPLPDFCVKVEFGETLNIESNGNHWQLQETENGFELHYDDVVITVYGYEYKEDEIIGFSWFINDKATVTYFAAKYGTTVKEFGETFVSHDEKGLSNVVWCIELKEIIDEEDPDDEDPIDPEDPDEEHPDDDDDDEECLECGGPEGPDDDDEPLPQTSDPISWAGGILGLGSLFMLISKRKDA
jgi:hypothetical protein